jgi:hypothetical protein
MFETNPQPMFVFDFDTLAFLDVNDAALHQYYYTREEFLSMTLVDISPVEELLANTNQTGSQPHIHTSGSWWHLKKTGEIMHVELKSHPVNYSGKKAYHMQITDITERKKEWDSLKKSEEKYRNIFENMQDVFFMTDLEGVVYDVSPSVDRYLGFSRDQLIGSPVSDLYADSNERERMIKSLLENGKVWDYLVKFITRNDEIIHVSINASLIYDKEGKPDLIEGSLRDVTERINSYETLRSSEEKYRSFFENHSVVKLIFDPFTQKIIDANNAAARFYGLSREKLLQTKTSEILSGTPEERKILTDKTRALGYLQYETRHKCMDGSMKDVEVFASNIVLSGKEYIYMNVNDITSRKQEDQQTRLLIQVIEQCPVSIIITDKEGRIEYVNPKFTRVTGHSLNEIKGRNQWFLYSGKYSGETYTEMWEMVMAGNEWNGEFPVTRKNGEQYWENVNVSPVINEKGQITHVVILGEDITERHKLWENLITGKEKIEATDKLKTAFINNISNEVRTPLNGIVGFTEMLINTEFSIENKRNFINIIKESSSRLLSTVNSYMDISMILSGTTKVYRKKFHLNSLLEELKEEYSEKCQNKGIELIVQLPKTPADILLNTDQTIVHKIMSHLLCNAVKYTEKGVIEFGFRKSNHIPEFYVTDSGIGIESNMIISLFESYKPAQQNVGCNYENTGLGLPIARGLVELLGGEISVQAKKTGGSTFYFTLPAEVIATVIQKEEIRTKQALTPANPVILVAEDDDFNFKFIETVLNKAEFKVVRAETGVEAVNICYNNPDISLVLMDLKMPVMGGIEATRQIKHFLPDLPVIALTAFVSSENEQNAFLSGCEEYIKKPVDRAHLLASVGHILGEKVN